MVCPLYQSIADAILSQHNLNSPTDVSEALGVYLLLLETIPEILNEL